MLVLVAGDTHIPNQRSSIPEPIKKLLVPSKIEQVISVGNIDEETLRLLHKVAKRPLISVIGNCDVPSADSRTSAILEVGKVRVGVVSSFEVIPQDDTDILAAKARELDVNLLIWGSANQENQSWAGHYFISPGSLTGAGSAPDDNDAGFCLLDITDKGVTVFMYTLHDDELTVEKALLQL